MKKIAAFGWRDRNVEPKGDEIICFGVNRIAGLRRVGTRAANYATMSSFFTFFPFGRWGVPNPFSRASRCRRGATVTFPLLWVGGRATKNTGIPSNFGADLKFKRTRWLECSHGRWKLRGTVFYFAVGFVTFGAGRRAFEVEFSGYHFLLMALSRNILWN